MIDRGRVGPVARALGFAGLLPQVALVAAVGLLQESNGPAGTVILAGIYPLAILSFLGGMWWGLAIRSDDLQAPTVAVAVVPSLIAVVLALVFFAALNGGYAGWTLVAIGSAVLLTLPVDRWLVARGLAPEGWMALRVPLSVGLGGLTIAAGALAGG